MPDASTDDQILLCGTTIAFNSGFIAKLLDVSDVGAERKAVEVPYATAGWIGVLFSCLAKMLPMSITMAHSPNADFKTVIKAAAEMVTISWAIPGNYTTAGTLACMGALTRYAARGGTEERVTATAVLTFSGEPTITAGTPVA